MKRRVEQAEQAASLLLFWTNQFNAMVTLAAKFERLAAFAS